MAGLSKLNSACAEKQCGSQKKVNVITRNGQNPENIIYILRQWFSFPNLLPRKFLLVASTCFFSSDLSTESEFIY